MPNQNPPVYQQASTTTISDGPKHVVLLHGLGRAKGSLRKLDKAFSNQGYQTHRFGYPSRFQSIDANLAFIQSKLPTDGPIAFVGHSLGGVLSLKLIRSLPSERRGALILLGAPVNGASIAAFLERSGIAREIFGPSLADLSSNAVKPGELPPTLVFAGTNNERPYIPGYYFHRFLSDAGPNDGTVLVSETYIEGAENRQVDVGHSFIMNHPQVISESLAFLVKHFPIWV